MKEFKKVYVEKTYLLIRGGMKEPVEGTAYQIVAEVTDEFGTAKIYCSDIISRKQLKYIPPSVRIYCYMGWNCMMWENTACGMRFPVIRTKETVKNEKSRLWLGLFNYSMIGLLIAFLLALGYEILIGRGAMVKELLLEMMGR